MDRAELHGVALLSALFVYMCNELFSCVSAADRDCAVWRETLQLCSSQHRAVALVSVCGSWRAALGAGK